MVETADVVVVGAGVHGASAAFHLARRGARVAVLERGTIAGGFVVASYGIRRSSTWVLPLTAALATASLVVCAPGLPEAVAGIVVNVAILGVVASVAFARPSPVGTSR